MLINAVIHFINKIIRVTVIILNEKKINRVAKKLNQIYGKDAQKMREAVAVLSYLNRLEEDEALDIILILFFGIPSSLYVKDIAFLYFSNMEAWTCLIIWIVLFYKSIQTIKERRKIPTKKIEKDLKYLDPLVRKKVEDIYYKKK